MDYNKFKELYHYGIKGQKWGVRRYQNIDGSLTEAGKIRYNETVFISGSSKTQDENSKYYRKELPDEIKSMIDQIISKNYRIIIGDAPGIDRQVQEYLNKKMYDKVEIYGPGEIRYTANKKWKTHKISSNKYAKDSKEYLAVKDKAMTKRSTQGLAITLDVGSTATKNNVSRLIEQNKNVKVYELSERGSKYDKWVR